VAKRAEGLPISPKIELSKTELLAALGRIDNDLKAQARVKAMENDFRHRIDIHLSALASSKLFRDYNTNPFVLLFYSSQKKLTNVKEIEEAIVPAKVFSSMETSAGRMVERVVLSHYGWQCIDSAMHTTESVVDGRKIENGLLRLVTLKSGPLCINDSMTHSISSELVTYVAKWAKASSVKNVEFTVGVLYGIPKKSNKKDWHILRRACDAVERLGRTARVVELPNGLWHCRFKIGNVNVKAQVCIGKSLWELIGGNHDAYTELLCAAIRSCVDPTSKVANLRPFDIPDLGEIIALTPSQSKLNFTILQKSQIEWFLLLSAHFSETLVD